MTDQKTLLLTGASRGIGAAVLGAAFLSQAYVLRRRVASGAPDVTAKTAHSRRTAVR